MAILSVYQMLSTVKGESKGQEDECDREYAVAYAMLLRERILHLLNVPVWRILLSSKLDILRIRHLYHISFNKDDKSLKKTYQASSVESLCHQYMAHFVQLLVYPV